MEGMPKLEACGLPLESWPTCCSEELQGLVLAERQGEALNLA